MDGRKKISKKAEKNKNSEERNNPMLRRFRSFAKEENCDLGLRRFVSRTSYTICGAQCKMKIQDPLFKNY